MPAPVSEATELSSAVFPEPPSDIVAIVGRPVAAACVATQLRPEILQTTRRVGRCPNCYGIRY